jgi:hypothetical protein
MRVVPAPVEGCRVWQSGLHSSGTVWQLLQLWLLWLLLCLLSVRVVVAVVTRKAAAATDIWVKPERKKCCSSRNNHSFQFSQQDFDINFFCNSHSLYIELNLQSIPNKTLELLLQRIINSFYNNNKLKLRLHGVSTLNLYSSFFTTKIISDFWPDKMKVET